MQIVIVMADNVYKSTTNYVVLCLQEINKWLFKWKSVNLKCKQCKTSSPTPLICQDSNENVKVYQFEKTKTKYQKIDKTTDKKI